MPLPPYDNFPELSEGKIALHQILAEDIGELIEISFYDAVPAKSVAEAKVMQDKINEDYLAGNSIHWGIRDQLTNKIVGTCGYYRGFEQESGELGCVLLPQYYGQGYMTAAMLLAIDFGLNNMGLKRIWAATGKDNSKAIKLLEKLHFRKVADLEDKEIEYEFNRN